MSLVFSERTTDWGEEEEEEESLAGGAKKQCQWWWTNKFATSGGADGDGGGGMSVLKKVYPWDRSRKSQQHNNRELLPQQRQAKSRTRRDVMID